MTARDPDRRIKRTRARLHEALASLIHEKPCDGVVVKEILARADVGRSTFYSHFRNKDDLLDSSIEEVLQLGRGVPAPGRRSIADEILECSRRAFEHIDRYLATGRQLDAATGE